MSGIGILTKTGSRVNKCQSDFRNCSEVVDDIGSGNCFPDVCRVLAVSGNQFDAGLSSDGTSEIVNVAG